MIASLINLKGTIKRIDTEKRDIVVQAAPDAPEITVHLWTTIEDTSGIRSEDNWREYLHVGDFVEINGHLGNSGRVIARPGGLNRRAAGEPENLVSLTGYKIDNDTILSRTPGGKDVFVKIEDDERFASLEINRLMCLIGQKTSDKVKISFIQAVNQGA